MTVNAAPATTPAEFRGAITRRLLPWLHGHMGIEAHFGVVGQVGSRISGNLRCHAHILVLARRHLPRGTDLPEWIVGRELAGPQTLRAQVLRRRDEVSLGGRLMRLENLPASQDAVARLGEASIDHLTYVAGQRFAEGRWWFESRGFFHALDEAASMELSPGPSPFAVSGFSSFRAAWFREYRARPFGRLSLPIADDRLPPPLRPIPTFGWRDRRRWDKAARRVAREARLPYARTRRMPRPEARSRPDPSRLEFSRPDDLIA